MVLNILPNILELNQINFTEHQQILGSGMVYHNLVAILKPDLFTRIVRVFIPKFEGVKLIKGEI